MSIESIVAQRLEFMRACPSQPFSLVNLRKMILASVEIFLIDNGLREGISDELAALRYNPEDGTNNNIWISLDGVHEVEGESKRPLITVKLGDVELSRLTMDNRAELDVHQHDDGATDNMIYAIPNLAVVCEVETNRYDQGLALCEGMLIHLISLRNAILSFDKVRAVTPGKISMPQRNPSSPDTWRASVSLSLHIDYSVTVRQESLLLKKVSAVIRMKPSVD
jgi:hypothetical protein